MAKISNIFGVLEIPDIYFGVNGSGPESTYEEKMRVPPPGTQTPCSLLLFCIFLASSWNFGKVPM